MFLLFVLCLSFFNMLFGISNILYFSSWEMAAIGFILTINGVLLYSFAFDKLEDKNENIQKTTRKAKE